MSGRIDAPWLRLAPLDADRCPTVRPGGNVMMWLQRSEGDDMVLYVRTGEPDVEVPWGVPVQLYCVYSRAPRPPPRVVSPVYPRPQPAHSAAVR